MGQSRITGPESQPKLTQVNIKTKIIVIIVLKLDLEVDREQGWVTSHVDH